MKIKHTKSEDKFKFEITLNERELKDLMDATGDIEHLLFQIPVEDVPDGIRRSVNQLDDFGDKLHEALMIALYGKDYL